MEEVVAAGVVAAAVVVVAAVVAVVVEVVIYKATRHRFAKHCLMQKGPETAGWRYFRLLHARSVHPPLTLPVRSDWLRKLSQVVI